VIKCQTNYASINLWKCVHIFLPLNHGSQNKEYLACMLCFQKHILHTYSLDIGTTSRYLPCLGTSAALYVIYGPLVITFSPCTMKMALPMGSDPFINTICWMEKLLLLVWLTFFHQWPRLCTYTMTQNITFSLWEHIQLSGNSSLTYIV